MIREYGYSSDWHWATDISNEKKQEVAEWILNLDHREYEYFKLILKDQYNVLLDEI